MKTVVSIALFTLLLVSGLQAQTAPTPAPSTATASASFLSTLTDPNTLVLAGMAASQLAEAKTDWQFTVGGKSYTLTPAQRLGIAGGIFGVCLAIEQVAPKSKKWVEVAGAVVMAYFAGRALANTYNHGTPVTATPSTVTSTFSPAVAAQGRTVAFAVRLR